MEFLLWKYVGALVFGLLVGSFLNVCIYRLSHNMSPAKGRSLCPNCGHLIAWYDNIPLFSFIFLRGRCRHCSVPISLRYPLVEFLTALLSLATFCTYPDPLSYLLYFIFLIAPLFVIVFIDLDTYTIPDSITLPGIVCGVLVRVARHPEQWMHEGMMSFFGIVVSGGMLLLIAWYAVRVRKKEGMGGGDIKLAAMLGAFFGPHDAVIILLLSACCGLLVSLPLMAMGRLKRDHPIPFGPFIVLAAYLLFFFHQSLYVLLS